MSVLSSMCRASTLVVLAACAATTGCGGDGANADVTPSDASGAATPGTAPDDGSTARGEADATVSPAPDASGAQGSSSDDGGPTGSARVDAGTASRKRGMAYGYDSKADLTALSAGIGWWYNWSPQPDATLPAGAYQALGVEFVPMIWGGTFDTATLAKQVPAGAKYLLTFNEPNFGTQANLTPAQAAALWPQIEAFAKSEGLKIVSPALNYCGGNCNETNPFDWLNAFFAACTGCEVDYVAMHWYACTKSALTGYLATYEQNYKKPLWLTEFSCLDASTITVAEEKQYMTDAVAALEADPMVFRYAWFTGRDTSQPAVNLLVPDAGALTPLGQQYVSLPMSP